MQDIPNGYEIRDGNIFYAYNGLLLKRYHNTLSVYDPGDTKNPLTVVGIPPEYRLRMSKGHDRHGKHSLKLHELFMAPGFKSILDTRLSRMNRR